MPVHSHTGLSRSRSASDGRLPYTVAAGVVVFATLMLHAASSGKLDFFRDELYFIVCGGSPQWGYVDQPPLVPLLAHASYVASHANPGWFRTIPALAHAATAALTMALVRVLGGRIYAATLAGVAVAAAPVLAAFGWLFTTNVFDPLAWTAVLYGAARVGRTGDERWWLLSGVALGVALEAKYGLVLYLPGLLVGVAASPLRTSLVRRWFWIAGALATSIALPSFMWQAVHHFPMIELLQNGAREGKNVPVPPLNFVVHVLVNLAPVTGLVAIAGLVWLVRPAQRRFGFLFVGWVVTLGVMIALHAKDYYFAAAQPALVAAGATAAAGSVRNAVARGSLFLLVASALFILPVTIPLGGAAGQLAVLSALHQEPQSSEALQQSRLSQDFADTIGWRPFARRVSQAMTRLNPARPEAAVVAGNYGEASALRLFGTLPEGSAVISTHNQYWLWGYAGWDGKTAIFIRRDVADLKAHCTSVEDLGPAGFTADAMPYERAKHIFVCRRLRQSVNVYWRSEKTYI